MKWPDRRALDLFGIDIPIVLAPMAGPGTPELAIAVSETGGLGSLPAAMSSADQLRRDLTSIRAATSRPINVNFFCHTPPNSDDAALDRWRARLAPYYRERGLDPAAPAPIAKRQPFNDEFCAIIDEHRPNVVSFHFGLPDPRLVDRVKATGARVIGCATTVDEARWLESRGCDAIIAMGLEAGGHRGMFLSTDVTRQVGTFSLVPQVVDAVRVPVIAAGGVADARGIVAALALGASAVQIGTAYLRCPEAKTSPVHRAALAAAAAHETAVTNVFTGRPARSIVNRLVSEVGPMSDDAPAFPLAAGALAPIVASFAPQGTHDFQSLWAGQSVALTREIGAAELTRTLAADALDRLR